MTAADLIKLRKAIGLTQREMAELMGLGQRAYQVIETSTGPLKDRHRRLAERAALERAVALKNPMLAPAPIRREALELARLIREG